jgi:hypothetical protein
MPAPPLPLHVNSADDGSARTGTIGLVEFDRGVFETLGGVPNTAGDTYILTNVPNVSPPPDFEGVPIYFAFPEETIDQKILPSFVIRRDSISWAMSRWHLGVTEYRVPAPGAHQSTVYHPITGNPIKTGWDHYEEKSQAVPADLLYTIQIRARYRNNLRVEAMQMLQYALRKYQPYTTLFVKDSLGDLRSYDAFNESPNPVDTKTDVANRTTTFNISLRVEAEIDLNDPYTIQALTSLPMFRFSFSE